MVMGGIKQSFRQGGWDDTCIGETFLPAYSLVAAVYIPYAVPSTYFVVIDATVSFVPYQGDLTSWCILLRIVRESRDAYSTYVRTSTYVPRTVFRDSTGLCNRARTTARLDVDEVVASPVKQRKRLTRSPIRVVHSVRALRTRRSGVSAACCLSPYESRALRSGGRESGIWTAG
jgi:hypothetical protein